MAYNNCDKCGRYAWLRKNDECFRCNPGKSSFKPKSGGVPGASKVRVQNSFNDFELFSSLKELEGYGASTRDMVSWLRNGDYSRKITHADIQRVLNKTFPRLPRKRKAMRLRPYLQIDPCPACDPPQAHVHAHDEQVYNHDTHIPRPRASKPDKRRRLVATVSSSFQQLVNDKAREMGITTADFVRGAVSRELLNIAKQDSNNDWRKKREIWMF